MCLNMLITGGLVVLFPIVLLYVLYEQWAAQQTSNSGLA
jgi:hypothetical protein